jgi:hypothetical protein
MLKRPGAAVAAGAFEIAIDLAFADGQPGARARASCEKLHMRCRQRRGNLEGGGRFYRSSRRPLAGPRQGTNVAHSRTRKIRVT